MTNPLEVFFSVWEREADKTVQLLRSLPGADYDLRPDPGGRSLGELAWHLAEGDAYISLGIANGKFERGMKPPNIERPRTVEALAPGYERVHREAIERLSTLSAADLSREIAFLDGSVRPVSELLWDFLVLHMVHHRGQLSVLARMAGATVPALFGPTREQTPKPAAK